MKKTTANIFGISSLVFWSMNVGVTRQIGEAHPYGMPGLSFLLSGIGLVLLDAARGTPLPWNSDARPRFWLFAGGAFVLYMIVYVCALSSASTREVVLPLGLVNYMWASLILLLMPLFFPGRVRWPVLAGGIALCVAGVALAMLWGMSLASLAKALREDWPAFLMMAAAAFLWAFYSNASRKWGGSANGVGWFMLASGAMFLAVWFVSGEPLGLTRAMTFPLILHALAINAAGYLFWDFGVRWGDIGLMGAMANFLPLGSVLFGSWYLGSSTTPGLWIGGALVTIGAMLCGKGFEPAR